MLPDAANALNQLSKGVNDRKQSPTLAYSEQQRLRDVTKRLSRKSEKSKDKISPYHVTNSRLKKARTQNKKRLSDFCHNFTDKKLTDMKI